MIPGPVLRQYETEVLMHDRTRQMRNFHLASYFGHEGLVSPIQKDHYSSDEEFQAAQQEQQILFEKIQKFIGEITRPVE